MNQLISNALGIRQDGGDLVIDPVLPAGLDGVQFDFRFAGAKMTFIYRITDGAVSRVVMNGKPMHAERVSNPYRQGGLRVAKDIMEREMKPEDRNIVEIFM